MQLNTIFEAFSHSVEIPLGPNPGVFLEVVPFVPRKVFSRGESEDFLRDLCTTRNTTCVDILEGAS